MSNNIVITPGIGATVAADNVSGVYYQQIKLDVGASGASAPVTAGGTNYLPVSIQAVGSLQFTIVPAASQQFPIINAPATTIAVSASAALPVSAVVGSPVFVRLSDGTNPISTLPVSGTVTANQGTAASASGAWPIQLCDATGHVAALTLVSAAYALNVNVVSSIATSGNQVDKTAFTDGGSVVAVNGAVYNDTIGSPSSGQAAALRMTVVRGLHVNLRNNSGTEIATSGNPVRVDPTGTTTQPVSGTVGANLTQVLGSAIIAAATGIQMIGLSDHSGNAFTDANPLIVMRASQGRTRVTKSVAVTASQTGDTLWTPATGKAFYIEKMIIALSTGGTLTVFDNTNSAPNIVTDGTMPIGYFPVGFEGEPWASSAVNNVLKYTSGSGTTGTITLHGFEE